MSELVDDGVSEAEPSLAARMRQYLIARGFSHSDRIPPERQLIAEFGVSRFELRKALAELERDGLIWRHVGRGTFVGARPVHNLNDLAYLRDLARPAQLLEARLAIEPELARLAALQATAADLEKIRSWAERGRQASDWRLYEAADTNLHNCIAHATHNKLLIHLFNELNTVRRAVLWDLKRASMRPPQDHFAFDEHDAIVEALVARSPAQAADRMRTHLSSVNRNLPRR
ncbi:FCD domain-containing protein (plasmid) [Limimaricola variabilis]|uniref:FadR/GntR family transcriptional regulator n=1 Tax=Limimaricola variabilis TaxID=1492771 RepID=UPI002AC9E162|nr:FCD domain-containing protein [Limimaricola variabilis]WPY96755.1 FCD domain-containing protein [Limimaricola variabilis]